MGDDGLSDHLNALWAKIATSLHEETIVLQQVSRETRARWDRQLNEERHQHLAEEQRLKANLENLTAKIAALEKENEELENQIKGRSSSKSRPHQDKEKEVRHWQNKILALERKNEKRSRAAQSIKDCLNKLGLTFGWVEEDSDETYLQIHGIHPSCDDKKFFLCFSQLGGADRFVVERAQPRFHEFEALAKETNESQNFVKLLLKSRWCWMQDHAKLESHRNN